MAAAFSVCGMKCAFPCPFAVCEAVVNLAYAAVAIPSHPSEFPHYFEAGTLCFVHGIDDFVAFKYPFKGLLVPPALSSAI